MSRPVQMPLFAALAATTTLLAAQPAPARVDRWVPEPGTHARTLEVGDDEREYLLHIPKSYDPKAEIGVPLVLMLHGRGSNARTAASPYYGWKAMAEEKGFIVAFPSAVGRPKSWRPNWGGRKSADSRFLARLIDTLAAELRIDASRVFMTGHSSGGIMSFSFAATHSDKVAAIGPVAGTIGYGRVTVPEPKAPVPVIIIHGMADRIVPYDSKRGAGARYRSLIGAPTSAAFWAEHNDCGEKPVRTRTHDGKVLVDTWSGGPDSATVVFHSIEGGSHGWPRGRNGPNATALIWEFFARHGRGEAAAPAPNAESEQEGNPTPKKDGGDAPTPRRKREAVHVGR